MKRQNVRTLALIVVTFTYLLVGAAIFDALESSYEENQKLEMDQLQDQYVKKYNISRDDFEKIYKLVLKMKPIKAGTQWKFAGSFYFATTVITTIGYGHSTPKTRGGKIFCMIYALPGIPLTIVMFQSIGERMNMGLTHTLLAIKRRLLRGTVSAQQRVSQTKLIFISSSFVTVVVGLGALIFSYYEKWNLLDSVYYCLITLTTIGFGDLVALQKNDFIAKRPDYVAFSLIFILFGLTVVSSMMNLLVLRFLTMNTEDERRDEIVAAAVHVQQKHQQHQWDNAIAQSIAKSNLKSDERLNRTSYNRVPTHSEVIITSNQSSFSDIDDDDDDNDNTHKYCTCCIIVLTGIRSLLQSSSITNMGAEQQTIVDRKFAKRCYFLRNSKQKNTLSDTEMQGSCGNNNKNDRNQLKHRRQYNKNNNNNNNNKSQWCRKRIKEKQQQKRHYTIARGPASHVRHLVESGVVIGGGGGTHFWNTEEDFGGSNMQREYQCRTGRSNAVPQICVQYAPGSQCHDGPDQYESPSISGSPGAEAFNSSHSEFDSIIYMSLSSPSRRRRCESI